MALEIFLYLYKAFLFTNNLVFQLLFTDFNTEFCCDNVRISNRTSQIAEYSGNFFLNQAEPPPLQIRDNFVNIEFESNFGYNSDTGWYLKWTTSLTPGTQTMLNA